MLKIFLFACVISIPMLFGCSPEACLTVDEPRITVGFFRKNRAGSVPADSVRRVIVSNVHGIGKSKDSNLIRVKTTFTILKLPLPANSTSAGFVIQTELPSITKDSFFVGYDKNINFISASCGYTNFYTNLKLKSHTFDSVSVLSTRADSVTRNIHLKIYF